MDAFGGVRMLDKSVLEMELWLRKAPQATSTQFATITQCKAQHHNNDSELAAAPLARV